MVKFLRAVDFAEKNLLTFFHYDVLFCEKNLCLGNKLQKLRSLEILRCTVHVIDILYPSC